MLTNQPAALPGSQVDACLVQKTRQPLYGSAGAVVGLQARERAAEAAARFMAQLLAGGQDLEAVQQSLQDEDSD